MICLVFICIICFVVFFIFVMEEILFKLDKMFVLIKLGVVINVNGSKLFFRFFIFLGCRICVVFL